MMRDGRPVHCWVVRLCRSGARKRLVQIAKNIVARGFGASDRQPFRMPQFTEVLGRMLDFHKVKQLVATRVASKSSNPSPFVDRWPRAMISHTCAQGYPVSLEIGSAAV